MTDHTTRQSRMLLNPAQLQQLLNEREAHHASEDTRRELVTAQLVAPQDVARALLALRFRGKK